MKLAVIIGRFQPFHIGHLSLINKAQEEADKVLILIGSSKQLPDFKNPFSYEERLAMLRSTLLEDDKRFIRPLPDEEHDADWIANVIGEVIAIEEDPTEVAIYTNPKDEEFYRKSFIFPVETLDEVPISATYVRESWYADSLWCVEEYLTEKVCMFLDEHPDRERLATEWSTTKSMKLIKEQGHPFENPMEPVSFAVIVQGTSMLVGRRGGTRGNGQLGLPGGYIESGETSLQGCMRETKEELGLDLHALIMAGSAQCLAQAVEENMGDLGIRTIGINYLFVLKPDLEVEVTVDGIETTDHEWLRVADVTLDNTLLFFNHNLVTKRLLSKVGDNK
jgi:bifunctional NMN adenylyltransferase/nudix hydrolase